MGYIYYKREQWKRAVDCYTKAHQMLPGDASLLSSLGLCLARAQMFPQAVDAFRQSLMLDPQSPATHSNIGLSYYLQDKVEMAIEHWRLVSQIDISYAERRGEELQKTFDDNLVALRPLNWRQRVVGLAPLLPPAHTRLLPGYGAANFQLMLSEVSVQQLAAQKRELELTNRHLAGMNLHLK